MTWIEQCMSLFPNSRNLTKEESEAYARVLESRSVIEEKDIYNLAKGSEEDEKV